MDPRDRRDIEEAVTEQLTGRGLSGQVVLGEDLLELRGHGPPVSIEPGIVLQQWPLLPPDMRRRRAAELAERLIAAQRLVGGTLEPPSSPFGAVRRLTVIKALAAVAGLLLVIGLARIAVTRAGGGSDRADAGALSENEIQRRGRLTRACEAMRDRIHRGASFGPFASEGWVVELWLARRSGTSLRDHPALGRVLAGGKLAPEADDGLAAVSDGLVEIAEGFSDDEAKRSPAWRGATLLLREGYARAYLDNDTRPRFLALADRLFESTGAELGALYARCADSPIHDVGAWFRGSDAPGAAAALVRAMGFFADGTAIDRALLKPSDDQGELDLLRSRAASLDLDALGRIVGANSGSITPSGPVVVTFPLGAPIKAGAASREAARRIGVGTGSE